MSHIKLFISFSALKSRLRLGEPDPDGCTRLTCPVCKTDRTAFKPIRHFTGMIPECFCPKEEVLPALGLERVRTDWPDSHGGLSGGRSRVATRCHVRAKVRT